jgi:hypothetical protein
MKSRDEANTQRRRLAGEIEGTISTTMESESILPKNGRKIAM